MKQLIIFPIITFPFSDIFFLFEGLYTIFNWDVFPERSELSFWGCRCYLGVGDVSVNRNKNSFWQIFKWSEAYVSSGHFDFRLKLFLKLWMIPWTRLWSRNSRLRSTVRLQNPFSFRWTKILRLLGRVQQTLLCWFELKIKYSILAKKVGI